MNKSKKSIQRRRRRRRRTKRHSIRTRNLTGKVIILIQFVLSCVCVGVVYYSGLIPVSGLVIMIMLLLLLVAGLFGLQFIRHNICIYISSMVVSVLISTILIVGIFYMIRANQMMSDVGGATYKTDNIVVVVRKNDMAENLTDVLDYSFGIQTSHNKENTRQIINHIQEMLGKEIDVRQFETVQDEAQALLDNEIGVAIYNEAFGSVIEETILGYSNQVRIVYRFSIDTEIDQETTNVEEPFNIYISGIDAYGSIETTSRSDVNIIMTVNPNTHKILLTTTPRDYYVVIPEVTKGQRDKLTHAGIYGVDASMATLENLYGIDISYCRLSG